jgi:small GTP-binding protein
MTSETSRTVLPKIVFYGKEMVGKTSLVLRARKNTFDPHSTPTIGAAYSTIDWKVKEGVGIKFSCWDTAGSSKFNMILPIYIRPSAAILICFDYPDPKSISMMINICRDYAPDSKIFVVATKIDMVDMNEKGYAAVQKVVTDMNASGIWYTSSLTGIGVAPLFDAIAMYLINSKPSDPTVIKTIHVNELLTEESPRKCKCLLS